MSILGETGGAIFLIICTMISGLLAWRTGVFRRGRLTTAPRVASGQTGWRLAFVLGIALFVWLAVNSLFLSYKQMINTRAGTTQPIEETLSSNDQAFLATVPELGAFAALWLGDWAAGGVELIGRLGLGWRRIGWAILWGLVGSLIVLPPLLCLLALISWVFDRLHLPPPKEHELLKLMSESHQLPAKILLIVGAVIVAPLAEEYLFRAHVQTLVRRALLGLSGAAEGARKPWVSWVAIFITSALFAVVHPMAWMWLPIFCLAVGLGYIYERTGSLWSSITVHCLFNSIMTASYLAGTH